MGRETDRERERERKRERGKAEVVRWKDRVCESEALEASILYGLRGWRDEGRGNKGTNREIIYLGEAVWPVMWQGCPLISYCPLRLASDAAGTPQLTGP